MKHILHAAGAALAIGGAVSASAQTNDEGVVRKLDEEQRRLVASGDADGLARLAHGSLRINAPGNRVLSREQFLTNMRNGEIAAEAFERTVEDIAVSGTVAVVMGREVFTPGPGSGLARAYGQAPLHRRYTNVYMRENGRWLWLARHANVIPAPAR